jgi:hypothetical protein
MTGAGTWLGKLWELLSSSSSSRLLYFSSLYYPHVSYIQLAMSNRIGKDSSIPQRRRDGCTECRRKKVKVKNFKKLLAGQLNIANKLSSVT